MSAALVIISESEFDEMFDHMTSHKSGYRNMHLRAVRTPKTGRELRYLHAMYALRGTPKQIEGMISGPNVFVHYKIARRANQLAQMVVIAATGDQRERDKIWETFSEKVLSRARAEPNEFGPTYLKGQYYLRRHRGGMPATHETCRQAIKSGVLHPKFVAQLQPWEFHLICRE
jgi:hypothetical protein